MELLKYIFFCIGYKVNHVSCDRTSFPGSKCYQYKGPQGGKVETNWKNKIVGKFIAFFFYTV
jgi:hypothetical protein